jgi:putative membrane protein
MLPCLCLSSAFGAELATKANQRQFSQLEWNWDPLILAGLLIAAIAYISGLRRMNGVARSRVIGVTRCASFAVGMAALFVVLITPFEALDDELFSAHMVQHLVLMMVAPPLLILGRPSLVFLWALPLSGRRALTRAWVRSGARRVGHSAMSPVVVWLLCSGALWFWHLPGPFRWALQSEFIHAVEHICFFATALMFWSLVFEPAAYRRMSYGGTLIFVATFGIQNGFLGAILTFAGHPLYAAYLPTTTAWGFTPLEDQQTAGLLMWIPASFIHLGTLGFLFVAWMRAAERRAILETRTRWSVVSHGQGLHFAWLAIVLLIGAGGCGHAPASPTWKIADADASRGPELIRIYGCGSCHNIPEVSRAVGNVGPPLGRFGERVYIAGVLRNTPTNLVRWLRDPQSVVPGNAMPNMDVTEKDARDLAAFLYSHSNWSDPAR